MASSIPSTETAVPSQKSSFLNLPPELRNRIYQAALIKPGHINLCPSEHIIHDVEGMERLAYHIQGFESFSSPKLLDELRVREQDMEKVPWDLFRVQHDLLYVREELAVGLLRTCRQVYREAVDFFWAGNTWCFPDDIQWHLLFRFLSTIGSNARARIKGLEVLAPMVEDPVSGVFKRLPVKNHPKLRMATPCRRDMILDYCDCRAKTFDLLMLERTLEKITFVVPPWCRIYTLNDSQGERKVPQGFLSKVSVVVESGALVSDKLSVEDFTSQGVREHFLSTFPNMETLVAWTN
ncbi:hypothetical protein G7Y79_00052g087860 [Physcia stellaris]|nr:hypothetical protein G7Y79_00052g087860 [Physcia stellaris]